MMYCFSVKALFHHGHMTQMSCESAFQCVSVFPPQLVSLIENNSVVVVRGSTGSGKTTLLPQFILDHYSEKNLSCNIVVTQPRKIGASSIARWVAAQRHCTLGSLVGYQVGRFGDFQQCYVDAHGISF